MADSCVPSASDPLDPMIRRFVDEMSRAFAGHPNLEALTHAEARGVAEAVRRPWREGGPQMAGVEERWAPAGDHDVRVRFYYPTPETAGDERRACLVYLHGGGWTLFSLDTHDRVMREYAARSGMIVAGVDYALAPEAKFPVALEEVVRVVAWIAAEGVDFGVESSALFIGGDSAGANLALAACLALRDRGSNARVRGMLLNYGAFWTSVSEDAARRFGGAGFMLSAREMETFWGNYLRDSGDAANPLACPIHADLAGLPPAFLTIAECDILAEQNDAMAIRLAAAGVATQAVVYRGATHSFLEAVSIAPLSDQALSDGADWLRWIAAREL